MHRVHIHDNLRIEMFKTLPDVVQNSLVTNVLRNLLTSCINRKQQQKIHHMVNFHTIIFHTSALRLRCAARGHCGRL